MNWGDERYVRIYTRDTADWLMLSWQARALILLLLRKADRLGIIALGSHGKRAVCIHTGMPWDVVEPALDELTNDGCISIYDPSRNVTSVMPGQTSVLAIRNFVAAQEAVSSASQRQRDYRERTLLRKVDVSSTPRHATSTPRDAGHNAGHSVPSVPYRTIPPTPHEPGAGTSAPSGPGTGRSPESAAAALVAKVAAAITVPQRPAESPDPPPRQNGGYAVAGSKSPVQRCAACGTTRMPFVLDQGRTLCRTCYDPPSVSDEDRAGALQALQGFSLAGKVPT